MVVGLCPPEACLASLTLFGMAGRSLMSGLARLGTFRGYPLGCWSLVASDLIQVFLFLPGTSSFRPALFKVLQGKADSATMPPWSSVAVGSLVVTGLASVGGPPVCVVFLGRNPMEVFYRCLTL